MHTKLFKNRTTALLAIIVMDLAALLIFFVSTNPGHLPLPALLIPFALLYVLFFILGLVVLRSLSLFRTYKPRAKVIIAAVISLLPFSLVVFQSLHQLQLQDIVIAFTLVGGIGFYVSRADYLR